MKTSLNLVIMLICILCMVTCIGFATHPPTTYDVVGSSACSDVALVSDCPTSPIYNFNQLISHDSLKSSYTSSGIYFDNIGDGFRLKGKLNALGWDSLTNKIDVYKNHKYYIGYNIEGTIVPTNNNLSVYFGSVGVVHYPTDAQIISIDNNASYDIIIQAGYDTDCDFTIKPILIDLTQMFGVGNEPATLDDLYKVVPKGSYFPYSTGVPVGGNGLNMYNQGVQDALSSFNVVLSTDTIQNSAYGVDFNGYNTLFGWHSDGVYSECALNGYMAIPVNSSLLQGTSITCKFLHAGIFGDNVPTVFDVGVIKQNVFTSMGQVDLGSHAERADYTATFTVPYDTNTIYIKYLGRDNVGVLYLTDINITYKLLNPQVQLDKAFDSGYNAGNSDGYNKGYTDGSRDGSEVSGFGWLRNIFASIGTIFDIKIFGDITLGTFFAVPLIMGVVMFIIHLARG